MYSAYKVTKQGDDQYTTLTYSFPNFAPVCHHMSSSNCCFLTCIQTSQEAGKMVWYSYLLKNFTQFVVIYTVKGFSVMKEMFFLEFCCIFYDPISSVQSLSHVRLFAIPWTAARQASLYNTNSRSPPKPTSIELVMPSNHLILYCPLLLLPSIFPSIRGFSNESALCMRWPKYWSFSFNISPSNEHPGLISFRMDWLDLPAVQGTLKSLLQHHSSKASILRCSAFFIVQISHPYMTTGTAWRIPWTV